MRKSKEVDAGSEGEQSSNSAIALEEKEKTVSQLENQPSLLSMQADVQEEFEVEASFNEEDEESGEVKISRQATAHQNRFALGTRLVIPVNHNPDNHTGRYTNPLFQDSLNF